MADLQRKCHQAEGGRSLVIVAELMQPSASVPHNSATSRIW